MGEEKDSSDTDINSAETNTKSNNNKEHKKRKSLEKVASEDGNSTSSSDNSSCDKTDDDSKSNNLEKVTKEKSEVVAEAASQPTTNTGEEKPAEFRVAPSNSGFKLRIVPLEKLLEKPKQEVKPEPPTKQKRLPERKNRKNFSIIEVSDTSEESDSDSDEGVHISKTKTTKTKTSNKLQAKPVKNSRLSLDDSKDSSITSSDSKRSSMSKDTPISRSVSRNSARPTTSKNSTKSLESSGEKKVTNNTSNSRSASRNSSDSRSSPAPTTATTTKSDDKVVQQPKQSHKLKRCVVRVKRIPLPAVASTRPSAPKLNGNNKPSLTEKRRNRNSSESDSSDFDMSKLKSKLEAINSDEDEDEVNNISSDGANSSDSEILPVRKKRVFQKRKKSSSGDDSDFEPKAKQPAKKRSRLKNNSSGDSNAGSDDDVDENGKIKRKHIRKIIKTKDLDISTKTAAKDEEDRRKRIEERQKVYNQIYEKPDSVEVSELVLDFDEDTKNPLLEVDKGLLKKLKPHQVSGVKFMWDACFETLNDAVEKPGSGCILAHCMGLGKTLQVVTLSHTLLANSRKTGVERVLIISPLSTLTNWAREFRQWMAFARKKNIEVYDISKYKDKATRIFKLNEWYEEGGVCILGYDMYRILSNEKAKGLKKKQRETLLKSLVEPGPDMVVCDEGHLLKNEKTSISKAVTRMRTLRRIVLTGTPLQNNLKEYYCMIQFIKPNLLGTYKEYLNRFVNPIMNGQYTDSTDRDIRLMKHRSHILHKMLEGCIQRRDYSVLAPYLPPKHEYVVYTSLSDLQQLLYEFYMTTQRELSGSDLSGKGARLFQDFQDLRRIWTHPMSLRVNSDVVIRKRLLANESDSMEEFIDDDDDEEESNGGGETSSDGSNGSCQSYNSINARGGGGPGKGAAKGGSKPRKTRNNPNVNGDDSDVAEVTLPDKDDPSEWWKRFVSDTELNNIHNSPKLAILFSLLQQCEAIGDKLLVFSQSLQSLDVIEHFLSLVNSNTKGHEFEGDVGDFKGFWTPGKDYFRLDGSCSVEHRESMCRQFNNVGNTRARLFLISTRAGGLGINLVAANRVVIFDVSWNPSHDTQSIFRVYRFGQDKPCYIYRLIAMGTMEQKVYERQVAKQATAKRVIDEQQISRHYNQSDLQELYTYELKPATEREIPILPKDRLFAELLSKHEKMLFKYHEHDSLLENEESENLSEEDRKAAWSEYEAERTRTVQTAQYISYDRGAFGQFGNASGSVTSNKIFGFRSDVLLQLLNMKIAQDHMELSQNQVIQLVPSYLQRLYAEMNNGDPSMYKDLLTLHTTLQHPSGMYMNPLLYANQEANAAGYNQAGGAPGAAGMITGAPIVPAPPVLPAPGFNPDEVYEID